MIKLSDKKADIKKQLKTEELNINVLIAFQEKLRDNVISYSKKIIQESFTDINSEKLNEVSDSFLDISKALKKSESIIDTCNQLKETFEILESDINGATLAIQKTKIEEYNKNYTALNKKINTETNELQNFISNYEKNEILKQFLEKDKEVTTATESNDVDNTSVSVLEELSNAEEQTNTSTLANIKEESTEETSDSKQFDSILEEYSKDTSEPSQEPEIVIEMPSETQTDEEKILNDIDSIADGEAFDIDQEANDDNSDNYIKNIYEENLKKSDFTIIEDDSDNTTTPDEEYNFVEKTLLISERENTVILPYTVEELKSRFENNPDKYKNLQDVIAQEYTVPLNYYRSPAISRFKEAYRLIRNREHGSLRHALDLATELFFKSSLHPAIITACKNSDELDIYLSCLEFDELEDFKIFNIIFEILPKELKKRLKASN